MRYQLAIFDLDGTLLDTTQGILKSVEYTIQHFGLPPLSHDILLSFIGPPIQESFAKVYGLSGSILQEIASIFRTNYSSYNLLKANPYNGIYDLFQRLSDMGIQTAIATYKREDYALTLLKHFDFYQYTNIMYGGDNENKLKKKDIIIKCIKTSKINDYNSVVMIGDTLHDAIGAMELNLDFIAVTYGFGFKQETYKDNHYLGYANAPIDILNLIIQNDEN